MWVRFVRDFSWEPPERKGRVALAFRAGAVAFVRRACGSAALAAGSAVPARRPERRV